MITANPETLAEAIASEREDAEVLRRKGFAEHAGLLEQQLDRIAAAGEPFVRWLSEAEAELRSGDSERTLRRYFRYLLECGLARYNPKSRRREYLMCAVRKRADTNAAFAEGLRGEIPA